MGRLINERTAKQVQNERNSAQKCKRAQIQNMVREMGSDGRMIDDNSSDLVESCIYFRSNYHEHGYCIAKIPVSMVNRTFVLEQVGTSSNTVLQKHNASMEAAGCAFGPRLPPLGSSHSAAAHLAALWALRPLVAASSRRACPRCSRRGRTSPKHAPQVLRGG